MSAEQNEPRVDDWVTLLAEELEDRSGMMAEDIEHQIRAFAPGPVAAPAPSAGFPSSVYVKSAGESGDLLFAVRGADDPGAVEYRLAVEPAPTPERSEAVAAIVKARDTMAKLHQAAVKANEPDTERMAFFAVDTLNDLLNDEYGPLATPASASVSDDEPHAHDWVRAGNESLHWGQVCAVDGCEARRYAAADALADLRQWGQHAEFIRRDHLMAKLDDLDRTAAAAPSRVDDGEPWVRKAAEAIVEAEIDAEGAHVLRAEELERIIAEHAPLAPSAGDVERNVEAAVRCCRLAGLRVTPGSRPLPSGVDVGDAEREAGERDHAVWSLETEGGGSRIGLTRDGRLFAERMPEAPAWTWASTRPLRWNQALALRPFLDRLAVDPAPSDVQEDE